MLQGIVIAVVAVLVGLDQLTKWLAVVYLKSGEPVTLIPGVLQLSYAENEGAAFGMLQGGRWFFVVLTGMMLVALLVFVLSGKLRRFWMFNCSAVLILAGGIGNLIDRLVQGYVVDFIETTFITFPLFNVADCCVVVGSLLLLVFFGFVYEDTAPTEETHGNTTDSSADG